MRIAWWAAPRLEEDADDGLRHALAPRPLLRPGVVKQAFPKVKIVAQPATVAEIKKTWAAKVKQWGPMFGANLATKPLIPSPLAGNSITLEGQPLEIHGPVQGDAAADSYVWIPSIKTVVLGDIAYQGIFPWTAETNADARAGWEKTLDEVAALGATTVIAGHKDPKLMDDASGITSTKAYLKDFDAAVATSKSAAELQAKMKAKYPKLAMDIVLQNRRRRPVPGRARGGAAPRGEEVAGPTMARWRWKRSVTLAWSG